MARQFVAINLSYLETTALVSAAPLTLACWFYADSYVPAAAVSLGSTTGSLQQFVLEPWSDQHLYADCGGSAFADATTTYTSGQWNHGCAVFASSTSRAVYLNGGNKGTNTTAATPTNINVANVGAYRDSSGRSRYFNGRLAEVGIWNVALTDGEVRALASGYAPSMVRPDALLNYTPLFGQVSPEEDWFGETDWTVSLATRGAHSPQTIYPSARKYFLPQLTVSSLPLFGQASL